MNLSETDKAYLAGIFDGEGCVGYYNANTSSETPAHHASVHICNINKQVIEWVQEKVGGGRISLMGMNDPKRRVAYQWQLGRKSQVKAFLESIRPFLIVKAAQVDTLLAMFDEESTYPARTITPELIELRQRTERNLKAMKWAGAEGVETRQAEPSSYLG